MQGVGSSEKPLSSRKTSVAFRIWAFFQARPGAFHPTLDGGLVAFASAARGLLPTPAEAVQQAANMIAIITHPEAAPNEIRHSLRGPDRRRESVSLGSLREQARKLRESSAGQFRRASGTRTAVQARLASPSPPLGPNKHGLAAHAELPGNRAKRLAVLQAREGSQPPRFHRARVSSGTYGVVGHKPTVPLNMHLSMYLCRGL